MTELTLDDRTFERSDGTWRRIRFSYGSPYSNGGPPDVTVTIETFERTDGKGFCFSSPNHTMLLTLDEVNVGILAGYLTAVSKLMWHQWTQSERQDARREAE